ncbi:MAG TPA: potassium-transporting ATPase subunit KdpB, partial [Verrucomicrobiae bacterium]|nr:potassium-transporting ATPase subunit KdpB [Verrucomicrobiae bacterium]
MATRAVSIFDSKIVWPATGQAFRKLDPRLMIKNPVMFVTLIGAAIATTDLFRSPPGQMAFVLQIAIWLWFTVLFANFAEAVAEGRGKAQARALRATRTRTSANKVVGDDKGEDTEVVDADSLRKDDVVMVRAGELIPADGEIIEGAATVDESAITGESAPVIREAGGDRSAVTGGTRVLSDQIKIRITANPGEGFLDRMISLVEGARRQKTPNEIALTILLSALTVVFLLAVVTLKPYGIYAGADFSNAVLVALLVCLIPTTIGGLLSAIGIAGMDRLLQKNVLAMSGRAVEAAGDVDVLLLDKTGTITMGNRQATAFVPAPGVTEAELADAAQLASLADETPEGRSIVVLAKQFGLRARSIHELSNAQFVPFTAQTRMSGV